MMDKQINWTKWSALGLGGLLGLSHISMLVMLATRQQSKYPKIDIPPVNQYSSVRVMAGEDGYSLEYRGNDPKSMFTTKTVNRGGFLKKGDTTTVTQEYTMDGAVHHGGPVSNGRTWIDPAGVGSFSEKRVVPKPRHVLRQEMVENQQEDLSVVALVLLRVLVSPLFLSLAGFWLVLLR